LDGGQDILSGILIESLLIITRRYSAEVPSFLSRETLIITLIDTAIIRQNVCINNVSTLAAKSIRRILAIHAPKALLRALGYIY
jgi:hypothetical protein